MWTFESQMVVTAVCMCGCGFRSQTQRRSCNTWCWQRSSSNQSTNHSLIDSFVIVLSVMPPYSMTDRAVPCTVQSGTVPTAIDLPGSSVK